MPLSVGKVFGLLELTDKFSQAIEGAADKFAAASTRIEKIGNNVTQLGDKMTMSLSLPLVALGGGAIKAAVDFEASFAGVRKTLDTTGLSASQAEAAFKEMAGQIREMALRMPLSVNEINRVAEAAGQLGVKRQDVVAFSETMIKLGTATNLTADEAATAMARFSNIMGEPTSNVDRLGAALVALGNNGASTEKEIVDMSLRLAGAGKTIGLTSSQVLGMANALSSLGIEAEMGGSAMSKMMIKIASAVSQGGDAMGKFAQIAHMTNEEFANLFKADPGAAIGKFIEGLGKTKSEGGDLLRVIDDLGISETRLRDTMLRVANAGTMVSDSMKLGQDAFRDNNALNNEYEQRLKTTQAQLILFRNKIYDLGITLGQTLIPAMMKLVDAAMPLLTSMEHMVVAFANLPEPVQTFGIALLGIVAAIGPVLSWGGRLISLLGAIGGFFGGGAAAGAGAGAAGAAAGGLTVGVMAFGGALVALGGTGLYALLKVGDAAKGLGESFRAGKTWAESFGNTLDFLKARHETWLSRAFGVFSENKPTGAGTRAKDISLPFEGPQVTNPVPPETHTSLTQFADELKKADDAIKGLAKTAYNDLVTAIKSGAFTMEQLKEKSGLSEVAIERVKDRIQQQAKAAKDAAKENKDLEKLFQSMADKVEYGLSPAFEHAFPAIVNYNDAAHKMAFAMMGWDKIDDAKEMVKSLTIAQEMGMPVSQMTRDTQDEINKTILAAIEAYRTLGMVAPDAMNKLYIATIQMPKAVGGIFGSSLPGKELPIPQAPKLPPTFFQQLFGDDFGAKLSNGIISAFQGGGDVGKTIGGLFGSKLGEMAGKTAGKAIGGLLGSTLGSIIPGIGTLAGGALGSFLSKGFSAIFGKGEGRSMVEDFAKQFDTSAMGSGFDELHAKLMALNVDGSTVGTSLWVALTQGVGKNNPAQAKAAIDAITEALAKQAAKQADAAKAAGDTAEAQTKATDAVQSKLDSLNDEYDRLFDSIKGEAPEEAMGVVERETRERMAAIDKERASLEEQLHKTLENWVKTDVPPIRIPYYYEREGPDLPSSIGSPGDSQSGSNNGTTQQINVSVDGRVIARAAIENMPDEINLQGV